MTSTLCEHDCGPFGACFLDSTSCLNNKCQWKCQCAHGYGGPDCSVPIERCATSSDSDSTKNGNHSSLDAHVCFNGGRCETYTVHDESKRRATRCNCQNAVGEAKRHATGHHQCEFATQFSCEEGLEFSNYAYCVNGGICKDMVPEGNPHPLCKCPDLFAGRHCQFLATEVPADEITYVQSGGSGSGGSSTPSRNAYNHTHGTHIVNGHSNAAGPVSAPKARDPGPSDSKSNSSAPFMALFVVSFTILLMFGIYRSRRTRRSRMAATLAPVDEPSSDGSEIVFDQGNDGTDEMFQDVDMDADSFIQSEAEHVYENTGSEDKLIV